MNERNKLDYIAEKYYSAVFILSNYSGTPADAICFLFDKCSFREFMEAGLLFENIPESCIGYFKELKEELEYIYKKQEIERNRLIKQFSAQENYIMLHTTPSTIVAKFRRGKHTKNIINNICYIAFELDRLKRIDINNIHFISGKDFKTLISLNSK